MANTQKADLPSKSESSLSPGPGHTKSNTPSPTSESPPAAHINNSSTVDHSTVTERSSPEEEPASPSSSSDMALVAHNNPTALLGGNGINKRYRPAPAKTFQCRGYGECRMVFSRSEHLARHIRYAILITLNSVPGIDVHHRHLLANILANVLSLVTAGSNSLGSITCANTLRPFTPIRQSKMNR